MVLPIPNFYYVTIIFLRQFFCNCHIIFPHHNFKIFTSLNYYWAIYGIVFKGVSITFPPPYLTPPPSTLLGYLHFLKSSIPTLPANRSFQVFLINRNATKKLSSINTIHVKQQNNVGFFIFNFTLKQMPVIFILINYILGNVYI